MKEITDRLKELAESEFSQFQSGLIKTSGAEILGVRTPALRAYAKQLMKSDAADRFMEELPHEYFDEYQLHAMIISQIKDYDTAICQTEKLLPFIDNWATCDQLRPKCFARNRDKLIVNVKKWLGSEQVYTKRFAIGMLLVHYLGEDFRPEYPESVAAVRSDEYYIKMMTAWYFAEALAKQYDHAVKYIRERKLDPWTHNKAIQKACESRRIPEQTKQYLRTLKV